MLNYQRPSFFNNFNPVAKNKSSSKNIRTAQSTFNTVNYIKKESSDMAYFLNEDKKKNMNLLNNLSNYINQTTDKNKQLYKINHESATTFSNINKNNNENDNLYDLAFAHYQLNNGDVLNGDFAVQIPKRLKYQMDLLRSKSNRAKTNKAANNQQNQVELETEEYNENEGEILKDYFNKNMINHPTKKTKNKNNFNTLTEKTLFSSDQTSGEVNFNNHNNFNNYSNSKNLNSNSKYQLNKNQINIHNMAQITRNNNNFYKSNSHQNTYTGISKSGSKQDGNDKVVISGLHAAKIRMLKGLNLKGEKKKSDAFLNVKCVGLKADFLLNGDNNTVKDGGKKEILSGLNKEDKTGRVKCSMSNSVKKTDNGFRKSKSGNFPVICKNEKK